MGSWNETCALSNLPIVGEDEVVWLLIAKSGYPSDQISGVDSCDYYWVRSLPLYGKYYDYGRVTYDESDSLYVEYTVRQFKEDLVPQEKRRRDEVLGITPPSRDSVSIENIETWLHEGCLYVEDLTPLEGNTPSHMKVESVMILRDVWDSFCAIPIEFGGGALTLARLKNEATEVVDAAVSSLSSYEENLQDNWFYATILRKLTFSSGYITSQDSSWAFRCAVADLASGDLLREELELLTQRMAELSMVKAVMSKSRMTWHPTTGSGSQDSALGITALLHVEMAKAAISSLEREISEMEIDAEGDEEDSYWVKSLKRKKDELSSIRLASSALCKVTA